MMAARLEVRVHDHVSFERTQNVVTAVNRAAFTVETRSRGAGVRGFGCCF